MKQYNKHKIWTFKYEPDTFDGLILNNDIKPKLKKALEEVPNLLLYGTAGVGKGTFTKILLKHTGYDHLWINASDETGIDVIRDKVKSFSTALGFTDLKIVVFNESDSLSQGAQGAQKMLKQLIEDVHKITRFVFLSNSETLMMDELKSRCWVIKVDNPPAIEIYKFCENILKQEHVSYTKKILLDIVKKCYPDIRKTIQTCQENTINKKLVGSSVSSSEDVYNNIFDNMKKGDVDTIRKLLRSSFIDYKELYRYLYNRIDDFSEPGLAILDIGEYMYRDGFVAIKEINFVTMVVSMLNNGSI